MTISAISSPAFIGAIHRNCAERMLLDQGIQMARERQAYYSDKEYAEALLGPDAD